LIDSNKTLKISDFGLSRHGIYTNTRTRKVIKILEMILLILLLLDIGSY